MTEDIRWLRTCSECSRDYYMSHSEERWQHGKLLGLRFSVADICAACFPEVLKRAREFRGGQDEQQRKG